MTPADLNNSSFNRYAPQGKGCALRYLSLLRRMPLSVLPSFLEQLTRYDWRFPAEKEELSERLAILEELDAVSFDALTAPFRRIRLPAQLADSDWVDQPERFVQDLTAHLWSSQQIEDYRNAAKSLLDSVEEKRSVALPVTPRMVIFLVDPTMQAPRQPLFSKLRKHGLLFTNAISRAQDDSPELLLAQRAATISAPYRHWCLEGGKAHTTTLAGVTRLSYLELEPVRTAVLAQMERGINAGSGPEILHRQLVAMTPAECDADKITSDPVLQRFAADLFTDGSGTQIYSTTFVQWAAREILRRSQPLTLLVRITPRVRQRGLNELITQNPDAIELDPEGSLIDADMAAYYTWLELQRLPGARHSVFVACFQGCSQAFLAGPSAPKGVVSPGRITVEQILGVADSTSAF